MRQVRAPRFSALPRAPNGMKTRRRGSRFRQARTTDAADSRRQPPPEPLAALPVRLHGPYNPWHPRLDHLGRTFLPKSAPGAIGGCEARTQRRIRSRRLRMRPRTTHRAAERGQAMECFVSLGAQTNPPAGWFESTVPSRTKTHLAAPISYRIYIAPASARRAGC
jgi:hypothetical protein